MDQLEIGLLSRQLDRLVAATVPQSLKESGHLAPKGRGPLVVKILYLCGYLGTNSLYSCESTLSLLSDGKLIFRSGCWKIFSSSLIRPSKLRHNTWRNYRPRSTNLFWQPDYIHIFKYFFLVVRIQKYGGLRHFINFSQAPQPYQNNTVGVFALWAPCSAKCCMFSSIPKVSNIFRSFKSCFLRP